MTAMFRKMLSKYAFSSRVLSIILAGCGLVASVLSEVNVVERVWFYKDKKVRFTVQLEIGRVVT